MMTRTVALEPTRVTLALLHSCLAVFLAGSDAAWAQGELVAAGNDIVTVYARTASGNVAPVRAIAGALTGFSGASNVAPDRVNNELIVSNCNPGSVLVFPLTADGNVAPTRKISGIATGLGCAGGVAVDATNNEILVVDEINNTMSSFARTASGNVAPLRVIQLTGTITAAASVALDVTNNEVALPDGVSNAIAVYSRTATGLAAPLRLISGLATGLNEPFSVAVDTLNNELLVANTGNASVSAFARTANGNTAPLRTISGGSTGLLSPTGIALDNVNNELLVGNDFPPGPSVTVYSRAASGDVAPLRTLGGAATGLAPPITLAVTTGAPAMTGAVSRKVHGAAGTFDLPLSLVATNPTTEPRSGPAQTIVMTFDSAITAATATVTEGTAAAAAPTFSGNSVIVNLTGVTNQQYVSVSLTNVASSDGGTGGTGSVRVGFLLGDVNQNRVISIADLALVNAQLAQTVTATNFLKDVNASGTLTVADKAIANANLTKALPAP